MAKEIFNRYEMKFRLNTTSFNEIIKDLMPNLTTDDYGDKHGYYSITNLYFDTHDNYFHQQNVDREIFRQKLRVRAYGDISLGDRCYVEIKKKFKGLSNKRRTIMSLEDAYRFLGINGRKPEIHTDSSNPLIMKEITFFKDYYDLEPKMIISYDRIAYEGKNDSGLRITFDRNLRCRLGDFRLESPEKGELFVPEDLVMMEVKVKHSVPLWLVDVLRKHGLNKQKFSKYSTCVTRITESQIKEKQIKKQIG